MCSKLLDSAEKVAVPVQGVPRKGGKDWPGGISAFTPDAEIINGRAAMIGFAALLVTEAIKHSAVFGA